MKGSEGHTRSVEVWTANPVPAADVSDILDKAERDRLDRFRFERDRNSYASAHALTRRLLSAAAPQPMEPAAWRFGVHEFGKPYVAPGLTPDPPRFNLSHTRALVAAAVAPDEVGVDVEAIGTRELAEELRERVLSPDESRALDGLQESERAQRFFSIWALKESYIKARGLGLRMPLKEISFGFTGPEEVTLDAAPDEPLGRWHVALRILPGPTSHALGLTVLKGSTHTLDARHREQDLAHGFQD